MSVRTMRFEFRSNLPREHEGGTVTGQKEISAGDFKLRMERMIKSAFVSTNAFTNLTIKKIWLMMVRSSHNSNIAEKVLAGAGMNNFYRPSSMSILHNLGFQKSKEAC